MSEQTRIEVDGHVDTPEEKEMQLESGDFPPTEPHYLDYCLGQEPRGSLPVLTVKIEGVHGRDDAS